MRKKNQQTNAMKPLFCKEKIVRLDFLYRYTILIYFVL